MFVARAPPPPRDRDKLPCTHALCVCVTTVLQGLPTVACPGEVCLLRAPVLRCRAWLHHVLHGSQRRWRWLQCPLEYVHTLSLSHCVPPCVSSLTTTTSPPPFSDHPPPIQVCMLVLLPPLPARHGCRRQCDWRGPQPVRDTQMLHTL